MMGSLSEDEECQFFDAQEDITSDSSDSSCTIENCKFSFRYKVWTKSPQSVQERRNKFLDFMALNFDSIISENPIDVCGAEFNGEVDRIMKNSGAELRTLSIEDVFSSSQSLSSSLSKNDSNLSEEFGLIICRNGNLEGEIKCNVDDLWKDGNESELQVVGSDQLSFGSSRSIQQFTQRDIKVTSNTTGIMNGVKKRWLNRLRSMTCMVDIQERDDDLSPNSSDPVCGARIQRVKVRHCGKRSKELSALFTGQDIQAHEGSILTMKFSLDGQYLASAGDDGIVRVWQVVEDERPNEIDGRDFDPSCVYFTVNHLSELAPLNVEKEKMSTSRSLRKSADSACIIFPPKAFRILEKPLHEFSGHRGEVLDLSWSNNNCLLSSSVDKTVRLWRVGCDHCLKVFSHSNYVTCIQFNPVDDNYFISGSIDGKVRVWEVTGCRVVDWISIRDIVSAVCYRPDGQGGIVGSMSGSCYFYNLSDNQFQLEAQICLHSKKKSLCKRITGIQFCPQDPSKVMVTCADSQVRILHGVDVIGKYRGVRNGGNQIFASFTSDGKHIVSACEDSNIYLWNCTSQEDSSPSHSKLNRSFERFSANASVAIAWPGLKIGDSENRTQNHTLDGNPPTLPFSSPADFSLGQEFIFESFPKGSATWPEEKLPTSNPLATSSTIRKSQYKFLKSSCQSTSSSHAWGLVIVTAGWDGQIRSFHNYGLPVPT